MALRLLKIIAPVSEKDRIPQILEDHDITGEISHELTDNLWTAEVIIPATGSDALLDTLDERYKNMKEFRVMMISVEAALPRQIPVSDTDSGNGAFSKPDKSVKPAHQRISREELYMDIHDVSGLNRFFVIMVVLSSIVAGIGLLRDNSAIVIGAMVIAPLLGPSVALALGTTLGDPLLIRRAMKTNVVGVFLALFVASLWGLFQPVDPSTSEIASRTTIGFGDIVLASASGMAGVLSMTLGSSSTIVGVMIAVALLPPLITCGLLLGSGQWLPAGYAFLVFTTNFICVNLTGVLTFVFQGIQPANWWAQTIARKATHRAIILWCLMLSVLVGIIWFANSS